MQNIILYLKEISPLKLVSFVSGFMILCFIFIIMIMKSPAQNFVPLYGNLDLKDSNKIVAELETQNIPYELRAEGTQILVPANKVLKLRMNMAQSGIPSKGALVGYEIFDHSDSLGTSSFVQNVNLLRALEGELGRTISSFANIENARVHLVTPKKELFSRESQIPSASIILSMKGSARLSKEQINAIGHLVATAVPSLELAKITIVDTAGRSLKLGASDENESGVIAASTEEYRINYENRLKRVIEELLEKSLGASNVKAQVSAEINFDRIITNYETFDPTGQVVRSTQEIFDKESSTEKDSSAVSVANNIPGDAAGASGGSQNSNNEHSDTTTNYEISKMVKNHVSETGVVKRLSIAVLVDGTYSIDKKTGDMIYAPRSEEDLKKYTALIKTAVGFDENRNDRIEIVNMQFIKDFTPVVEESNMSWFKAQLPNLLQTVVIGLVVVLVLLLVVRPIAMRAFESTKTELEQMELLEVQNAAAKSQETLDQIKASSQEMQNNINMPKFDLKIKSALANQSLNDVVAKYPNETLITLRKWLTND
jgi:flagellar M-ring protein FliF